MRYTYKFTEQSDKPPYKCTKRIRWTNGRFSHITGECGPVGFRYAVFVNRASEVWIPLHDLTPKTHAAINAAHQ